MRAADLSQPLERLGEQRLLLQQLFGVLRGERLQQGRPLRGEGDKDAAAVGQRLAPLDQPAGDEAIDHLHRAVVLEQHLIANSRIMIAPVGYVLTTSKA